MAALTRAQIVDAFHGYGRPRSRWLVGGELERHLLVPSGAPTPYFGRHGVSELLHALIREGWVPHREGPHPIALLKNGASVTLEPGGQFELSGKPYATVGEVAAEAQAFQDDVDRLLEGTGVRQVALGYTPFARIEDVPWVPKGRYGIMRRHMAEAGTLGHHMMKGTCATQASFDFSDEADCARKVRLATALAPLVTALFANSPLTRGRPNGWASFRGHIWTKTDPARTGMPDAAARFSYERWIDYLLDVPMMFTKVNGTWRPANGRTFRDWMATGEPGVAEWDLHLTSVFPEVRVKHQIEVRMADCVPLDLANAFFALFTGIFYCKRASDGARAVAEQFIRFGTREARFDEACRHGLKGTVGGRSLTSWAEDLVTVARDGLSRCSPDDVPLTDPLVRLVERGESPAHRVLRLAATLDHDALLDQLHPGVPRP
jgi:glutamate--cysteine ligase